MRPYLRLLYCTWAFLLIAPAFAAAQDTGATGYTTFVRGNPIGREDVTVRQDASGLTVTSEGRVGAPANLTIRRSEFRYGPDGAPLGFELLGTVNGGDVTIRTTVTGNNATTQSSQTGTRTTALNPRALLHANGIVGSYVALARRLGETAPGSEVRMLVIPETEIGVRLLNVQNERMQLGSEFLNARRYDVLLMSPGSNTAVTITTGVDGNLLSVRVPSQGVDIMRVDLASVTTRTQVHSNPGDEAVTIPATGFNLGATITRPKSAAPGARLPAVIIVSGFGVNDRDGYVVGIPVMGQLAGALADAGFLAVRYDKRGYGQSGGRSESATITDYADDARTVLRWLLERKDVDPKRIALIGDSDGGWVAMLAASRERRFAALATIGAPASTGAELVLDLQKRTLDQLDLTPEERLKRETLQKQIIAAVRSEKGLADLPREIRTQADTPWFQSVLNFSPAKTLKEVRQPMLFAHAGLDHEVPVADAERLAQIANKESDSPSVELLIIKGVNHLLVPAVTGEFREYGSLPDRKLAADVPTALAAWLTRTFATIK
ncbi:MAG TPA: alpha/beta fold hydrolase [Vicinamibacterales bacterium]|nr:alpha/beta fold hydrolase [Vicinamibacterales bacterium]